MLDKPKKALFDLYGKIKAVCLNANGVTVKQFDWGNALADSLIFAGIGFFTTYASGLTIGHTVADSLHLALVTAGLQFLTFLAVKRGIIKDSEKPSNTVV